MPAPGLNDEVGGAADDPATTTTSGVELVLRGGTTSADAAGVGVVASALAAEVATAGVAVTAADRRGCGVVVGRTVPFGVATAVGGGVGTGQTPVGDGGVRDALCDSYRKPSASPSWKVWLETPRLDWLQPPLPRLTYIAQYGLLAVQHPEGYCCGS